MHGQFRLFRAVARTYSQDYPQKMGTESFHANSTHGTLCFEQYFGAMPGAILLEVGIRRRK